MESQFPPSIYFTPFCAIFQEEKPKGYDLFTISAGILDSLEKVSE